MPRNRILPQMFDVRPVDESGGLDWEKIDKIKSAAELKKTSRDEPFREVSADYQPIDDENGRKMKYQRWLLMQKIITQKREVEEERKRQLTLKREMEVRLERERMRRIKAEEELKNAILEKNQSLEEERNKIQGELEKSEDGYFSNFREIEDDHFFPAKDYPKRLDEIDDNLDDRRKKKTGKLNPFSAFKALSFSLASVLLIVAIGVSSFFVKQKGLEMKGRVLGVTQEGLGDFQRAVEEIKSQNFEASALEFSAAYEKFERASEEMGGFNNFLSETVRFVPFVSQLSSGKYSIEAGKQLAEAGERMSRIAASFSAVKNPVDNQGRSFLSLFREAESEMEGAERNLTEAERLLSKVKTDDLPKDKRTQFIELKGKLSDVLQFISGFTQNKHLVEDLLGGNGPRKYLFLFQNNHEMRATGGFIGSYGVLDISNGRVRKFFIDEIFNPDGQLKEKIVPPLPIQKISAAWTLHDSNWFPDFPVSAEKAILFYEKAGGPTTDGVITLTPTFIQKLLRITGPIKMDEYGVVIDAENFMEKTQSEVEINYDKEQNRPKKIIADLASIILDKLLNPKDAKTAMDTVTVLGEGLNEKHILLYSRNSEVQKFIAQAGWSGNVKQIGGDYLSVINSNINGFKTDGVIEENIDHVAEIQEDGSIIDTVSITRHHGGGVTGYEWWDKVNSDYMRVYVPEGSVLLSAEGQTREVNEPPLDYDKLRFNRDKQVENEERDIKIDDASGTRIYKDAGKTVFANWVYVSPQETVTMKYTYKLPFRIDGTSDRQSGKKYSVFFQKQSGSAGSRLKFLVRYPGNWTVDSGYSERYEGDLKIDRLKEVKFTE